MKWIINLILWCFDKFADDYVHLENTPKAIFFITEWINNLTDCYNETYDIELAKVGVALFAGFVVGKSKATEKQCN